MRRGKTKELNCFLSKEITEEEVELYTIQVIETVFENTVTMKDMKKILTLVQEELPGASSKIVNEVIKDYI
jgi:uncharacterized protein YqeY